MRRCEMSDILLACLLPLAFLLLACGIYFSANRTRNVVIHSQLPLLPLSSLSMIFRLSDVRSAKYVQTTKMNLLAASSRS